VWERKEEISSAEESGAYAIIIVCRPGIDETISE